MSTLSSLASRTMTTATKPAQEWQTWALGAFLSLLLLLVTWGYQSLVSRMSELQDTITELSRTGTPIIRERMAAQDARIAALERAADRNDTAHERILAELQILRETLVVRGQLSPRQNGQPK